MDDETAQRILANLGEIKVLVRRIEQWALPAVVLLLFILLAVCAK